MVNFRLVPDIENRKIRDLSEIKFNGADFNLRNDLFGQRTLNVNSGRELIKSRSIFEVGNQSVKIYPDEI